MLNNDTSYSTLMNQSTVDDEIDLRQIAASLNRNRRLIASFAGASMLLSSIYAFTAKPVWEGKFQIVLERQDSVGSGRLAQVGSSNPLIASLGIFTDGGRSKLATEVKILESPLVLKPTYEFVKANKAKAGEDVSDLTFSDWREDNLKIKLVKGTSVLNITYQDTQAKLIIPVMEKISRDYQLYSERDRSKSILNGLLFTREQVKKFRQQAAISSRALDAFSIRYGISSRGKSIANSNLIDLSNLLNGSTIGGTSQSTFQPETNTSQKGDAFAQLASINKELIRRQQHFTSRDPGVRALIRERNALRRYIELTAGGSLTLPGQIPATKEDAQELILKFNELDRTARRDIATLDSLESTLLSLEVEQARQTDPWELISTPTLLDSPIAPRKGRIISLGLLAGIVSGSCAALLKDRSKGLVFSTTELKMLLPCPLLKQLSTINTAAWQDAADLLASGPLESAGKSPIGLVPVGKVPADQLQAFASKLRQTLGGRELVVSNDLRKTSICATQLLLTAPGVATRTELAQLNEKLALQGSPLAGWILLDPELELS